MVPPRYRDPWLQPFWSLIEPALVPDVSILDVGSGRKPALGADERPARCHYVGLDISRKELDAAPRGSYDDVVVGDLAQRIVDLEKRFDVVVSWQTFEHVKPLSAALENTRAYLRPGGSLVAQLSGRYAAFALVARLVPQRVGVWAMQRLLGREPETVFPTSYDACYYDAIEKMLCPWSDWQIIPRYQGADYFAFSRLVERAYLRYESWLTRSGHRNLATHYLISAHR
jgi:SAM-dependent methyltransferase